MRIIGVLLARMGSSRLAGKSLAPLYDRSTVGHIIERMQAFERLDAVVLATPDTPEDVPLQAEGRRYGAEVFKGSTDDVLDRLYQAAKAHQADVVVHVGGDQPFADPFLMAQALALLEQHQADYVFNFKKQTYPSGQEQDAMTFAALEQAWQRATLKTHRVNALSYFHHFAHDFKIIDFEYPRNMARHRWTLDYPEDLTFFQEVYKRLYPSKPIFTTEDIFDLLAAEPNLAAINMHLSQYTPDQPAYWDSEGYMNDMRSDIKQLVALGCQADEAGKLREAAQHYQQAALILAELAQRAEKLA